MSKSDVMGIAPLRTQAETYESGGQFSTSVHLPRPAWTQHDEAVQHPCALAPGRAVSIVRNGGVSSRKAPVMAIMVSVVSTALTTGFWLVLLHLTL
jgi:hypothetical protein